MKKITLSTISVLGSRKVKTLKKVFLLLFQGQCHTEIE